MKEMFEPLSELSEFNIIKERLAKKDELLQIVGCVSSQMEHFLYGISQGFKYKIIITFSEQKAKEIYENCRFYSSNVFIYPAKDLIFYSADIHGNYILGQRLNLLKEIAALNEDEEITIIAEAPALLDKVFPLEKMLGTVFKIGMDSIIETEALRKKLVSLGYENVSQVEKCGQFSIRGSIIDIFSFGEDAPFRIDLWGDEIDVMKSFDAESQRSIENLEEITIYPATEFVLSSAEIEEGIDKINSELEKTCKKFEKDEKYEEAKRLKEGVNEFVETLEYSPANAPIDSFIDYFCKETVSFADYFDAENAVFFVDEPARVKDRLKEIEAEYKESAKNRAEKGYILPGQKKLLIDKSKLYEKLNSSKTIAFTSLDQKCEGLKVAEKFSISAKNLNTYNRSYELLLKDLKNYRKNAFKAVLIVDSKIRGERIANALMDDGINAYFSEREDIEQNKGEVLVRMGSLRHGFEYPLIKFVVISESDVWGEKKKTKKKRRYSGSKLNSFAELSIGDYVVHESYGLGIYRGIEKVESDNIAKDYIKIEYAGGGNLFIPVSRFDAIQKYASVNAKKPKLNKLGTKEWSNTKARVKAAVGDVAADLVRLYAVRQMQVGYKFSKDSVWQTEFEEQFQFEETKDQLEAIEDTKRDMESAKVMDRLICGDVGYGKTEIAIRAAFKAVQDGKQVAFLVPTTILAQQHYNTLVQRVSKYPVNVGLLSRFKTQAEQKKTVEALKNGQIDIVVGTHRLLSKDVNFKDLGLLIIDEEQRFGVTHKEKIKQLRKNVDVLTLSATPIPRTLHMSLAGIRDMSILEEAPVDRVPIQTYVLEYNEEMIREAINREMARGGQVYYVYNRVNGIMDVEVKLEKMLPDARIAYAHGRMNEKELEAIMYDFINGEIDILVSTSIIETGLDISNVNTIIIHDAENFGLSQLYQLRGRVGRTNRTAYAFLMYRRNKLLKEVAEKRLQAIREYTDLGSGFKIALRDLEIRGAGNILGSEQSGHMEAVGYDMYCKLLNEAVSKLKGIELGEEYETVVDMPFDAYIPATYIKSEHQKLDMYKKIACIESMEEYEDIQDELMDRFGDLPKAVKSLMEVALIRAEAKKRYITEISGDKNKILVKMYKNAKVNVEKIPDLIKEMKGRLTFHADAAQPYFEYMPKNIKPNVDAIEKSLFELFEKLDTILI